METFDRSTKIVSARLEVALLLLYNIRFQLLGSVTYRRSISETSKKPSRPELHRLRRKINYTVEMEYFREIHGSWRNSTFVIIDWVVERRGNFRNRVDCLDISL